MNERKPKPVATWTIHTDGAICPQRGISGLGAIARNPHGQICYWWHKRVGRLTCNEAEYAAAIFALEQMIQSNRVAEIDELVIYSDSRVLVDQMMGRAVAHAPALRLAQERLRRLVGRFRKVRFQHISREHNRLADALAFEAVDEPGRSPGPKSAGPNLELWREMEASWRDE